MDDITLHHLLVVAGVLAALLTVAPGLIWLERRLLALWQDRYGPNRAGPFGVLIVLADTIKLFFKEDWIPPFADKFVFVLAPAIVWRMLTRNAHYWLSGDQLRPGSSRFKAAHVLAIHSVTAQS